MRYLNLASHAVTAIGLVAVVGAIVFDLGSAVLLTGLLLAWAGLVKIVVVHLWKHVAGLGTDRHDPIPPI